MSEEFAPSRRQFFVAGAVAAAALPGASSVTSLFADKPFDMQDLAEWKSHVGKQFFLNDQTQMTLVAVKGGQKQPAVGQKRRHNFTAVFETDRQVESDGLYRVAHAELGHAPLYLQPGVSTRGAPTMRATFS
ncbi:MAG: hypothetical protein ABW182_14495 [Sphingomonas sp.]